MRGEIEVGESKGSDRRRYAQGIEAKGVKQATDSSLTRRTRRGLSRRCEQARHAPFSGTQRL